MIVSVGHANRALVDWCAWRSSVDPKNSPVIFAPLREESGGWIYFARMPQFIKVGVTAHVSGRLAMLKADLCLKGAPDLLVAIGPVAWSCEKHVLRLLKPWRTPLRSARSREWFTWCPPVANMVHRLREAGLAATG